MTRRLRIDVSIGIQHHPRRADTLPRLLDAVPEAEVIADPDPDGFPSPWRTYREALERTPDSATHRCIVQDDVTPCRDFAAAVHAAAASQSDHVLALFHGGQPRENMHILAAALHAGKAWARIGTLRWVPAVALVWPRDAIRPVLDWVEEQNYPVQFRADDEIIGRALRATGVREVLAAVPSIVQHDDVVPSLLGQRAKAGADTGRVAAHWVGDADAVRLPWEAGVV